MACSATERAGRRKRASRGCRLRMRVCISGGDPLRGVPRGDGYLHVRDRGPGGRRPAGGVVRIEGGHLHEHGTQCRRLQRAFGRKRRGGPSQGCETSGSSGRRHGRDRNIEGPLFPCFGQEVAPRLQFFPASGSNGRHDPVLLSDQVFRPEVVMPVATHLIAHRRSGYRSVRSS